jgi:hypothetical protein
MADDKKRPWRKLILVLVAVLVLIPVLYFLVSDATYSEGNRAGVLMKFSKKGFVFKTYEGEINMGGMGNLPNTAQVNQIWDFSVLDQGTADTLMHLEGRKVSLHYREVYKNMAWQGETKYFVDGVQLITQ